MIPAPVAWEYVLDFPLDEQPGIWASFQGLFDSTIRPSRRADRRAHCPTALRRSTRKTVGSWKAGNPAGRCKKHGEGGHADYFDCSRTSR
jgi:hypothetical protein